MAYAGLCEFLRLFLCIVYVLRRSFQREKEGGQNLWSESGKMGLFINDIIRTVFSLG